MANLSSTALDNISDHHPLEFFRTLLTAETATAQAALFNDSS